MRLNAVASCQVHLQVLWLVSGDGHEKLVCDNKLGSKFVKT